MSKEFAYFRGIISASSAGLSEPSQTSINYGNTGSLLTINSHYIRLAKDKAPLSIPDFTFHDVTDSSGSIWNHPENTSTPASLQSTGDLTASTASTGRWVWLIRNVNSYRSDFQIQNISFPGGAGPYGYGTPSNTVSSLSQWFETHAFDQFLDAADVDTAAEVKSEYQGKLSVFSNLTSSVINSQWCLDTSGTGSSGTGITLTGYGILYESSGSHTGGNCAYLRSMPITYTGTPTINFNYAMYSTTTSDVGQVDLYWVVDV